MRTLNMSERECHRYDFLVRPIGTDLLFFNFLNFIFYLGLITTPHVFYVHMTYVYSLFMFHSSHDPMAKRSHYRIMIFYMTFGVLLYGRTLTLILILFLHNSTTPILPVHVDQRRPHC